jgi:hypothetical protein
VLQKNPIIYIYNGNHNILILILNIFSVFWLPLQLDIFGHLLGLSQPKCPHLKTEGAGVFRASSGSEPVGFGDEGFLVSSDLWSLLITSPSSLKMRRSTGTST